MNKIEKSKTALLVLSIIFLVASVLLLVFGIILLAGSLSAEKIKVVEMIFGIICILAFVPFVVLGIYGLFVGTALKATKGSIAQGNLGMGTVNASLCKKCGNQLNGESFCPKCGESANGEMICKKCGAKNDVSNTTCINCGADLR